MPTPRKQKIILSDTPYYHCVSRCVRRAFLCGEDKLSGKSYEHRRYWVEERLLYLSQVFAVDVCAYAVMSNHTHVVLYVNESKARRWSDREVIERWHQLHKGTMVTQQFIKEGGVPEQSYYTSIKQRTRIAQHGKQPTDLRPFVGNPRADQPDGLPFELMDYLALVDLTGRALHPNKRGSINVSQAAILARLNISAESWLMIANDFEAHTYSAVVGEEVITSYCQTHQRKRRAGISRYRKMFAA